MKEKIDSNVSKGSATRAELNNILSESITSQKTSPATEKHGKRQKSARLDFSGAKEVVYLSSDYRIIDEDQAPISNKGGLPSSSKLAEPIVACSKSARPTSQSAKLTASAACTESARSTAPATVVPASAQVGLADSVG
jgi:hypothetical protein